MYFHDKRLMFPVRVETPDPLFAKMLQQALGGYEGEIRVVFQYLFQAWNSRGPEKYRDLRLHTATEDLGHIEMLATAIALNLEGSPEAVQMEAARHNPMVAAVMGGMNPRAYLSGGMGALAADSEGNPFDGSWVVSTGNLAADLYANAEGEMLNQVALSRLFSMTDDPGMKEMLRFLISRDAMHQQQWLAVIEELGGHPGVLPIPNSFPHDEDHETREFAYTFLTTSADGTPAPAGRWTSGPSLDGRGEFGVKHLQPMGEEPRLAPPMPSTFPEVQELVGGAGEDTTLIVTPGD
ncbi:putative manganese catalase [Deinococcus carri]|uniref:Manganese catalase n=1 Tax=Deinococcus carri TaxID=1211323 RepID=A0ABP9W6T3_9DEIO